MKVGAVLLDLYSTLVEERSDNSFYAEVSRTLNLAPTAFYSSYRQHGAATMRGELPGMVERVRAACRSLNAPCSDQQIADAVHQHLPLFYEAIRRYPDTLTTLKNLARCNIRLALVSNASQYSFLVLEQLNLASYFQAVVLSCSLGVLKPHPRIYLEACRRLSAAPTECVFVGDGGDQELAGARQLGMTTVLVDRGLPHTDGARSDASYVISTLDALLPLIDSLLANDSAAGAGLGPERNSDTGRL